MNRNTLIRMAVGAVAGAALGLAFANACTWVITTASLGLFLSFLVWLLGALMLVGTCYTADSLILSTLSDKRIDAVCNTTRGWLTSMRAKLTT